MPVDQHLLIALILKHTAVYIASAKEDLNAGPMGEYLSFDLALKAVYNKRMPKDMPTLNRSAIFKRAGYHIRPGHHDILEADWYLFLNFLKRQ